MKQDRFAGRYIIKLLSSVVIAGLNIIIQLLLPRALSVEEYGYYSYNLNIFTSVVVMANLSASNALVSRFSKRNEEIGYVRFYLKFFAVMALVLNIGLFVLYSFLPRVRDSFGGQTIGTVILALVSYIVTKLLSDTISVYDATAISRFPAMMQMLLKVLMSVAVVGGYFLGILDLRLFYIFLSLITGGIVLLLLLLYSKDHKKRFAVRYDRGIKIYLKEYYEFCKPLVLATVIAQAVVIIMNYSLMHYSGVTEQAMFGAAWQLNALLAYVFQPYAELLKREFAVLAEDGVKLKDRLIQSIRIMFFVTAYFAVFIAVFAGVILPILYGDKYAGAVTVVQLVMLYTVYQAIGQVSGAFFIACEWTRANAVFTVSAQVLTLIFVFLFQIPNPLFPDSLGANGIALNYVLVNVINVAMMIGYILNRLKGRIASEMIMQLGTLFILLLPAALLYALTGLLFVADGMIFLILRVFFAGVLYTAAAVLVIWVKPDIIGVTREAIRDRLKSGKIRLFGRGKEK